MITVAAAARRGSETTRLCDGAAVARSMRTPRPAQFAATACMLQDLEGPVRTRAPSAVECLGDLVGMARLDTRIDGVKDSIAAARIRAPVLA